MATLTKEIVVAQLESEEDFPVCLSVVWEWLGFSSKGTASRSFENLAFVQGEDFEVFRLDAKNSKVGRPEKEIKMTVDCFKMWAMQVQTDQGKEVRKYYLRVEKEYRSMLRDRQQLMPEITEDHVLAFQFKRDTLQPWIDQNPAAVQILWGMLGQQLVLPQPTQNSPQFALPSAEIQEALSGAFLNLNRSGLAMNKLFHFLDRIPSMGEMGGKAIDELTEALSEAADKIKDLQKTHATKAQKLQSEVDKLRQEKGSLEKRVTELDAENLRLVDRISEIKNSGSQKLLPGI